MCRCVDLKIDRLNTPAFVGCLSNAKPAYWHLLYLAGNKGRSKCRTLILSPDIPRPNVKQSQVWAHLYENRQKKKLNRERNLHQHVRLNMTVIVNTAYGRFTNVNYY